MLVAGMQWVIAPMLVYLEGNPRSMYEMAVDDVTYFGAVVPAYLAMCIGLLLVGDKSEREMQIRAADGCAQLLRRHPALPWILALVSGLGSAGAILFPGPLAFFWYLVSSLRYSSVLLLIYANDRRWKAWALAILSVSLGESAAASLFHDFLLWAFVVLIYYFYARRTNVRAKLLVLCSAVLLTIITQAAKGDYRAEIATGQLNAGAGTYLSVASSRLEDYVTGRRPVGEAYEDILMRTNQGWIISNIISHMEYRPLAGGDTIVQGTVAGLVPRFLAPTKSIAGGRETFIRFTGRDLDEGTSMGASIIGEGYGNFGGQLNCIFMFAYGLIVAGVLLLLSRFRTPLMLCLIPVALLHVIKAETDFVTNFNYLIKGAALVIFLHYCIVRILNKRDSHSVRYTGSHPRRVRAN